MTTTTLPDVGTDTTVVVDVDLDRVPMCEAGDRCVGDQGPAVARMRAKHRCDHVESELICEPCTRQALEHMTSVVRLICGVCGDQHPCLMMVHIIVRPL